MSPTVAVIFIPFILLSSNAGEAPTKQRLHELLKAATQYLASGDLERALNLFETADAVPLFEAPNYYAIPGLAETRCLLGDIAGGAALLQDLGCMLEIDSAAKVCYTGKATRDAPGQANPALTPKCFERMCAEVFLDYYADPTAEQLARIRSLKRKAEAIEKICRGAAVENAKPPGI